MARPKVPAIPDDKIVFFREQLYRELSHMFEWTGLPATVPSDYIERNLVRHGYVLFYKDENIGLDVLRATVEGYNRHDLPVKARTWTNTTTGEVRPQIERRIKYLSTNENAQEEFDEDLDGVLICNMAFGESCKDIVNHFAERLALAQQAFDTNLLWANIPYIFQTGSDETRLSIEKMFSEIFTGKPFIIADKSLFTDNADRTGLPTGIPFIGKELHDIINEIKMQFRQTVGFDTAGVEKAERVNTLEIESNTQHTKTVLQIMLEQRQKACDAINAFFGESISVDIRHNEITPVGGGEEDGTDNSGTEDIDREDEL